MGLRSTTFRVASVVALFVTMASGVAFSPVDEAIAAPKLSCKAGFKPGKTAVSLVPGAKVKCVNSASAVLGKKLLTGNKNTCFACHAAGGIAPYTLMLGNLQTQNYTLAVTDITTAFNAHSAEMSGATMTAKDAKNISQFLQTQKLPN